MKKNLIIASALILAASTMCFAQEPTKTSTETTVKAPQTQDFKRPPKGPDFAKRHAEFEKRLQLTDEQKAKAKQIREEGFEKIKPIMEKIKEKRNEIDTVKLSRIAVQAQEEKINQLKKEIGALKQEAHRIRMENMKAFEAILTKKQIKELKKMKEEGRKKFDKKHKKHHPDFDHKGPRPHHPSDFPPPPKAE